jgi:CRISPR-associated protein Cas2
MRFVVCYDIADDRRRERVAAALLDYGSRVQESVFLATLDAALHARMVERLSQLADVAADSVFVFPLCRSCGSRVTVIGAAHLPEEQDFYVL